MTLNSRNKFFLWSLLVVLPHYASSEESPFRLNSSKEITLLGTATLFNAFGLYSIATTPGLNYVQISSLSSTDLNRIDRIATNNWSTTFDQLSDIGLYGAITISPTLFLLSNSTQNRDYLTIGILGLETALLTSGLTTSAKGLFKRVRPYTYGPHASNEMKEHREARFSFFSGHTSMTACASFFTASVLTAYSSNKKLRKWYWASAAILPAFVGFSRVKAGKHFPTDVIAGYLVGAGMGIGVPLSHRVKKKGVDWSLAPGLNTGWNGLTLSIRF